MENNNNNKQPNNSNNKFSSYWIYGLLAVFLLALNFYGLTGSTPEALKWGDFEQMVRDGDIADLQLINGKEVHVYLKEDALEKYQNLKPATSKFGSRPSFTFEAIEAKTFQEKLAKIQEDEGIAKESLVYVEPKTQPNWLAPILSWLLPIAIIIVIWIFIMRRVSGGAGGPGAQIFNIGKSKATLFDNNSKVTVSFKDVAGLDEAKEEVMEVVDFFKASKKIYCPWWARFLKVSYW